MVVCYLKKIVLFYYEFTPIRLSSLIGSNSTVINPCSRTSLHPPDFPQHLTLAVVGTDQSGGPVSTSRFSLDCRRTARDHRAPDLCGLVMDLCY